jgi:orotidine-5'-phosphate decarboxylase
MSMKQPKDYIIFPLDLPSVKEAKRYIELLKGHVGMFKVGLEIFVESGPDIVNFIRSSGAAKVFLDLKLHDIPATVSRATERISELGVSFVTVHCGETEDMLKAAVAGSRGEVQVLGVTVLTSVSSEDIRAAGFKEEYGSDMMKLVLKRADMARAAGCAGVVCSGREVSFIKDSLGTDFVAVSPGIRPARESSTPDDQKRITTPAQAVQSGSDYLVIGRPIRDANDPKEAAIRIAEEINSALIAKG